MSTKRPVYDAGSIAVLEGLEPVRTRPGMYIGSTGSSGLHHLVYEVVDNAVDEAMAGHCTRIEVTLLADGGCRVLDNGRGIPVDRHPRFPKKSAAEVVLTVLHAGGKFGGDGYKMSGGLHGVGVSVVNALSSRLDLDIWRDGKHWQMSFAPVGHGKAMKPGEPMGPLQAVGPAPRGKTGTQVTFWPDPEVFTESVEFSARTIGERLQVMAFLNRGLEINFVDQREGHQQEKLFVAHGGIVDFVGHLNAAKAPLFDKVGSFSAAGPEGEVEVAWQWNAGYNEGLHSFANGISTTEGGMHAEGYRKALTQALNRYARQKGLLKEKEENLGGDDAREGMTAIVAVRLTDPQFEGQTKTKLGNPEIRTLVERATNEHFARWLEEHPNEAKAIVAKATLAAKARVAARKARDLTRRKTALDSGGLPGRLSDCTARTGGECFIVEGPSAGGTAKMARNPATQAILPLKGKVLNVERAPLDKILKNAEIQSLIAAIGGGVGRSFDVSKIRYDKVITLSVGRDEPVLVTGPDGMLRLVAIGDQVDSWLDEGVEVPDSEVACLDPKGLRSRVSPIKRVIRHQHQGAMLRVTTRYGRSVSVTPGHSLFTWSDRGLELVPSDRLKVGDLVVAPRFIPRPRHHPSHFDVLDLLLQTGGAGRLRVEHESVRLVRAARSLRRAPSSAYNYDDERVDLLPEDRAGLIAARAAAGISQQQMADHLGYKQAASISEFETGRRRFAARVLTEYCRLVEVEEPPPAKVHRSEFDRWMGDGEESAHRWGEVRPVCWAESISPAELPLIDQGAQLRPRNRPKASVPRMWELSTDFFYFLGWYAAEGCQDSHRRVALNLGSDDEPYVPSILAAVRGAFRHEPKVARYGNGQMAIYLTPPCLGRVLDALGLGGVASTKRLPDLVLNAAPEHQLAFLRGYFLGDGTKTSASSLTFSTASRSLANGLGYLLGQFGVLASISYAGPREAVMKNGHVIRSKGRYSIAVCGKDQLEILRPVWATSVHARRMERYIAGGQKSHAGKGSVRISETLVGLPIGAISTVEHDGDVYDLSVAEDESFVAGFGGGLMAHNTDADVDGGHITVLLLTFFFRQMLPLLEAGKVYVAQTPLYSTEIGGKKLYIADDKERARIVAANPRRNLVFSRFKGLGEMDADELKGTVMDPATRRLAVVDVEQASVADGIFSLLMGDDVPSRRRWIEANAAEAEHLDV